MTTAFLVCAPRLGYRFLFLAFFVAAYPLWHADFPTIVVHHEVTIPALDVPSVERSVPASERLGSCRG
jgi:hypothetical protein